MEKNKIRTLRAEEIECRIGTISEKGLSLLLYKDARVDQNILDETFGMFGWCRAHEKIGDALYCTVSIKDENGEWIAKQDVGVESYSDAVKGAASDSFKRACFNIGIGRELYTAPFIWIPAERAEIKNDGKKYYTKERYAVTSIEYDEQRNIVALSISNQKGTEIFSYKKQKMKESSKPLSKVQRFNLQEEMRRTGVTDLDIMNRYKLDTLEIMTEETYGKVMRALERSKGLVA